MTPVFSYDNLTNTCASEPLPSVSSHCHTYSPSFSNVSKEVYLNVLLVLDRDGNVLSRTQTPTLACVPESEPFLIGMGDNLLKHLRGFDRSPTITQTADAIQSVLSDQIPRFETVYPIEFGDGLRWFRNRVFLASESTEHSCLVQHEEITPSVIAFEQSQKEHLEDQYFRLIAEGADKASFLLDELGQIQWINPAFTKLFGYSLQDVTKRDINSVLRLMECGTQYLTRFQDALMRRANFNGEVYAYSQAGQGMWIALELRLVESEEFSSPRLVGYCSDVTATREKNEQLQHTLNQAEEVGRQLADSQKVLDFALRGADLAFWNWDLTTGVVTFNDQWASNLGYTIDELPQHISTFQGLLHPSDKFTTERAISDCLQSSEDADSLLDVEFRLRCRSGEYQWMNARARVVKRNSDGSPKLLCGVQYNIQARKNAELQIEGLVRLIEDSSNEVYIFDADSLEFLSANRGARLNLGYSDAELQEKTLLDTMPEMSSARFRSMVRPLVSQKKQRIEFETVLSRKDGSRYPVHVFLQKTKLINHSVYAAFVLDLTQRKVLEKQLAQSQKLQSLGQVAAGIAHEINSPMHMLNENLNFMRQAWKEIREYPDLPAITSSDNVPDAEEDASTTRVRKMCGNFEDAIDESLMGVDRVVGITKAMKQLAHPGRIEKTTTDLNQLLQDTITVSKNRWNRSCILDLALDENLPTIDALPSELSQVMLNLMVNAVDAIEERFSSSDQVPGRIGIRTWQEEEWAVFEFEDNGGGIPKSRLNHIFDPFYTTKEAGKGTGQGLTISHHIIVEKHQGTIAVESQPEQGTRFTVRLPMTSTVHIHDQGQTNERLGG